MAWMKELVTKCSNSYCERRAVVEVYDAFNTNMGTFCRICGKDRVQRLDEEQGQFGGKVR